MTDGLLITGTFYWKLLNQDESILDEGFVKNIITQEGDRIYGQRGWMTSGAPAAPTGMQYGSGTTATAKTGAGAAIVTYVSGSARAFDTGYPADALNGSSREVTYQCRWPSGVATNSAVIEFVLINQATATDSAAPVANTISRIKVGSAINKGSDKILVGILKHSFLGA